MAEEPREPEGRSFSELTVELIEQAAGLAGERLSAPIRAAGSQVARILLAAGAALIALVAGVVFLGVAVGNAVGLAPPERRWWIYLLVAGVFLAIGAVLGFVALGRRESEEKQGGEEDV